MVTKRKPKRTTTQDIPSPGMRANGLRVAQSPASVAARWQPGRSGNPSGRPKGRTDFVSRARQWVNSGDEAGIGTLFAVASNPDHRHWDAAVRTILAYAIGQPDQHVTLDGIGQTVVRFVIERPGGQPLLPPGETVEGEARELPPAPE